MKASTWKDYEESRESARAGFAEGADAAFQSMVPLYNAATVCGIAYVAHAIASTPQLSATEIAIRAVGISAAAFAGALAGSGVAGAIASTMARNELLFLHPHTTPNRPARRLGAAFMIVAGLAGGAAASGAVYDKIFKAVPVTAPTR